jgi:hypothetical protein
MPNWVTNRIKFANKESFYAFRGQYLKTIERDNGETEEFFDFNLLIPMPESLNIEDGSRTKDGIDISLLRMRQQRVPGYEKIAEAVANYRTKNALMFFFSVNRTDADIEEDAAFYEKQGKLDEVLELGRTAINNILEYGYATWYNWSVEKWGTKWNSCSYRDDPDALEVWFNTAWSTPEPVIAKLVALMGPEAFEEIEYADEDIGCNCGSYIIDGGGPAFAHPHENQSDQAMECAIRLNDAYDYYKLVDGHWEYKEEEEEPVDQVPASA